MSENTSEVTSDKIIKLGSEKEITLKPWNAKTKKDFVTVFKVKQEKVSEDDVLNVLVKPYIDKPDIYYSPKEIQFLLIELRKLSIEDKIEFIMDCDNPECGKETKVSLDLDDIRKYTPNKLPSETNGIVWRDINDPSAIMTLSRKYPNELVYDIRKMLHIKEYKGKVITSFEEILKILEDISLPEDKELDVLYKSVMSELEIGAEITCEHCDFKKSYTFDIIPTFFDPLLPKK